MLPPCPSMQPQKGSPTPKLGNFLHSTDQTNSSPSSLSGRAQNQAQTWIFPPRPCRGCVSNFVGADREYPKAGGFIEYFDSHDMPGTIMVAGATFCQEVQGQVGRGSIKRPPQHTGSCEKAKPQLSSLRRVVVFSIHLGMGIRQTCPGIQPCGWVCPVA